MFIQEKGLVRMEQVALPSVVDPVKLYTGNPNSLTKTNLCDIQFFIDSRYGGIFITDIYCRKGLYCAN
jgi:hypothetical protein